MSKKNANHDYENTDLEKEVLSVKLLSAGFVLDEASFRGKKIPYYGIEYFLEPDVNERYAISPNVKNVIEDLKIDDNGNKKNLTFPMAILFGDEKKDDFYLLSAKLRVVLDRELTDFERECLLVTSPYKREEDNGRRYYVIEAETQEIGEVKLIRAVESILVFTYRKLSTIPDKLFLPKGLKILGEWNGRYGDIELFIDLEKQELIDKQSLIKDDVYPKSYPFAILFNFNDDRKYCAVNNESEFIEAVRKLGRVMGSKVPAVSTENRGAGYFVGHGSHQVLL